ncbi:MAG: hypothetical protein ABIN69_11495 [Aestuariivirga sp.]
MSNSLRNVSLAIALLVGVAPLMMSASASALSMTECSAKFKAAKAAGSDGGLKWNDFRKAQCGTDAAAATPPAPSATAAPAVKPAKVTAPAATAPVAPATTASGSFMKDCSASWKAMKANNTTPAGMTWKQFVAAKCVVPASAAATAPAAKATTAVAPTTPVTTASGSFMKDCSASWKAMKAANTTPAGMTWKQFVAAKCVVAGAAPATPAVAAKATTKATPVIVAPAEPSDTPDDKPLATADKNGKAFTPGQMAAHQRIGECANQWRGLKASNKLPAGTKWPQFWSACNKQLKAAGQ